MAGRSKFSLSRLAPVSINLLQTQIVDRMALFHITKSDLSGRNDRSVNAIWQINCYHQKYVCHFSYNLSKVYEQKKILLCSWLDARSCSAFRKFGILLKI